MPINRIQFQPGLPLAKFFERYGTEAQCADALKALRWLDGFRCPRAVPRSAIRCKYAGGAQQPQAIN